MEYKELYPQEYTDWRTNPSPERLSNILQKFKRLIDATASKYKGTIPPDALKTYGAKYAVDAIKNYNPDVNVKLSTWIVNYMKQLHRLNYKAQQAARLPENLQMRVGEYRSAIEDLTNELKRPPSMTEIADHIKRPVSLVEKLNKQMYNELQEGFMEYDPMTITSQDPRIDYIYHDLDPEHKIIFEHLTGYGGKPIMSKKDIAKKLNISKPSVSTKSNTIKQMLEEVLSMGKYS